MIFINSGKKASVVNGFYSSVNHIFLKIFSATLWAFSGLKKDPYALASNDANRSRMWVR